MFDNTPNHSTKFKEKNWAEINNDARRTYSTNSQIKFKNSMLKSNLFYYSDAYILVSGTITVASLTTDEGSSGIEVVFKNYAPFTYCISKINNTRIDNAKDIDVVMAMYNLIEYSAFC